MAMMVEVKHGNSNSRSSSPVGWRIATKKNLVRCMLLSVALALALSTLLSLQYQDVPSSPSSPSSTLLMLALDDNVHRRPLQQYQQQLQQSSRSQISTANESGSSHPIFNHHQQTVHDQPPEELSLRREQQIEQMSPQKQETPSPPPFQQNQQTSPPVQAKVAEDLPTKPERIQVEKIDPDQEWTESPVPNSTATASPSSPAITTTTIIQPNPIEHQQQTTRGTIRVTHIGNSIQFYNFFPTFFKSILETAGWEVIPGDQACLKGAVSFAMLARPRGCPQKLKMTPTNSSLAHDFVILNDRSFEPAFLENRARASEVLNTMYAPWLYENNVTPIFLQTAAWREMLMPELHSFKYFTKWVRDGYHVYVKGVNSVLKQLYNNATTSRTTTESNDIQWAKLAPVGDAYARLHESNNVTWYGLYQSDHRHPSQVGALLQAFVLLCTMFPEELPPKYESTWWNDQAWRRHNSNKELIPSPEEALELWETALAVCNMTVPRTNETLGQQVLITE